MKESEERRPDPDQLLRHIEAAEDQSRSGRLKIFLGYASGVGKSFRMLKEGLRRKQRGEDVVIGALQPGQDPAVEDLAKAFEIIPPLEIRGRQVMDLPALLRRKPQVCLIDGLAHQNPEGSWNPKRYQDAEQLRAAGITIITTVNLQHIDDYQAQIEQLTGKKSTDTVPRQFLMSANEIELVDLPPSQLFERLGKHAGEISQKEERLQLSELRERALLLAAAVVDQQLATYYESSGLNQQKSTQERILVCTTPRACALAMITAGKRIADRFHGDLFVLYIQQPNLSQAFQEAIASQMALAREAGAHVEVLEEQNPLSAILRYARENRITQIFIGQSLHVKWWDRWLGNRVDRLLRAAEGMDVCVFPH